MGIRFVYPITASLLFLLLPSWSDAKSFPADAPTEKNTVWAEPEGKYAAEELRGYLSRITEHNWKIVAVPEQAAIRLRLQPNKADRDEFTVHSDGKTLEITGVNRRSLFYGVCALLERTAGCRFYSPSEELIPTLPGWKIPDVLDFGETAEFRSRQIRLEWDQNGSMALWTAKNRYNMITMDFWLWDQPGGVQIRQVAEQYGLKMGGNGHGIFYLLKADTYFASHPEWYPEINGKRVPAKNTGDNICYSNPAARAQLIHNLVEYCMRHPYLSSINLWPGDGGLICRCPQCRNKSMMELYGVLMTEAKSALSELFPKVKFSMLAYNYDLADKKSSSLNPPETASTVPAMFAFWGQNLAVPLQDNPEPGHRQALNYITDYARRHPGQASIFAYYTDTYMNSDICPSFGRSMVRDLRFYRKIGIDEICLLWIPWAPSDMKWTQWMATQNAALLGHLMMDLSAPIDDLYRAGTLKLQERLDTILGRLSAVVFPFAPPRVIDAWGCGFSREVMKWEPVPERRQLDEQRLKAFRQAEAELKTLVSQLHASNDKNTRQMCEYIQYCNVRVAGLRCIFEAQMAIRDRQWANAASWLERALATNMSEEQPETSAWLRRVKEQMKQTKTPAVK